MGRLAKSDVAYLLRGVAWVLFALAGLAFWIGGRLISVIAGTDSVLGEMAGIGLAIVSAGLGLWARSAAEEVELVLEFSPKSESESVRK